VEPTFGSIGLRTHALRQSARSEAADRTAEDFLVRSRLLRRDIEFERSVAGYFTGTGLAITSLIDHRSSGDGRSIRLPEALPLKLPVGDAIRRRRSVRSYTGDAMPIAYLATILRAANGIAGYARRGVDELPVSLRSTPSAGALYPIQLEVAALRVDDLTKGVFLYDPINGVLRPVADADAADAIVAAVAAPEEIITISTASAILLLVARPWRSMRKYGPRGMRHVFHEAGAVAAHIHLAAVALGWGSVDCASLYDDEVHEALQIDGISTALVHGVVLGAPG
jgi:SagB-type dehydrogenase family enzyme